VPERRQPLDYSLPSHEQRPRAARRTFSDSSPRRMALGVFVLVEVLAVPLLLTWGRNGWFNSDDWDFLATRSGADVGDWFRGHFGHWVTLPFLAYRLLWWLVGLRYGTYLLLAVVLHLIAAALLRAVMRRAGVSPWVATITASLLIFFGAGAADVLVAFQITFIATLVFGLSQLLLADHDGPIDRRDYFGLVAGIAALMCSGVAVAMTVIVGLAVLLRRGWRIAIFHTLPVAGLYLVWSVSAPAGQSTRVLQAHTPAEVIRFVVIGLEAAFGRLAQLPALGVVLVALLVTGLVIHCQSEGITALRGRVAAPIALLVGSIVFLVLAGIQRAGVPTRYGGIFKGLGPEGARDSRYVYVVAVMVLPSIALAADAIIKRQRQLAAPLAVLFVVGLAGNIHEFNDYGYTLARAHSDSRLIEIAPRLPIAHQLPRSLQVGSALQGGPTLGWLLESARSGRIPLVRLTPNGLATETLQLALQPLAAGAARTGSCRTLTTTTPTTTVLRKGDSLTLTTGTASIIYMPTGGGRSRPMPVPTGQTFAAIAGPLKFLIVAAPGAEPEHVSICR
jgi:hypothetical protein